MNSDELAKMVEMARGFQEWELDNDNGTNFRRLDVIDLADTPQAGPVIAQGVGEELGWFLTQVPVTIVALAEELATLKAAANRMAVAIRSAKSNAVYDSAFDDGDGNEYPVFAIDSDYVHSLYRALDDYERPKQEVK